MYKHELLRLFINCIYQLYWLLSIILNALLLSSVNLYAIVIYFSSILWWPSSAQHIRKKPQHNKMITTERKRVGTQKKRVATQWKRVATQWKRAVTQRKQIAIQRKQAVTQRKRSATQRKQIAIQRKRATTQWKRVTTLIHCSASAYEAQQRQSTNSGHNLFI